MLKYIFLIGTLAIGVLQCQLKEKDMHSNEDRQPNHLIDESSPYLLQHAYNPVDWYPWGEEALQKAREEDKLLIISIGYSACHWCHVMEKESFEDSLVAATMNAHFVSVKVDREERPDIDDIYMTACQLAGETSCGWPLNAFALPDGRPIWAGTYFPKKNWIQILEYFQKLKTDEREKLEKYASQLTEGIQLQENALVNMEPETPDFSDDQAIQMAITFLAGMDKRMGGSAGAPKFPMPVNYGFLLRFAELYDHDKAREATFLTLDKMAEGGIYDHLGGGFARYSTDARWHIPHFEKMLYDNGQLLSLYSHGYQLTQDRQYLRIIDETIAFLTRELRDPSGGFYSSLDADSEGEEGKFYVWSSDEIDTLLTDETQRNLFRDRYDVRNQGNWEDGKNVLQIASSTGDLAKKYRIEESRVRELLASAKDILLKARESRVRPGLDDKMLCSWNGLVLTGLADAYKATEDEKYLDLALDCGAFIRKAYLQDNHRLLRNHKAGKSSINGFLDDYAFAIRAFIALYEVTFDEKWLEDAHAMTEYAIGHFLDDSSGYFFYTSDLDPPLVTRKKELSDNVIPASNSAMAHNLHLLGLYYYDQQYLDMASSMLGRIVPQILESGQPGFYANWCDLLLSHLNPYFEVAVVGPESEKLSHEMMHHYQPRAIFLGGENEGTLELLKDKLIEGETLIYVCKDKVCKLPVKTATEAMTLME